MKGWKTRLFAVGTALVGVAGTLGYEIDPALVARFFNELLILIGLAVGILRQFTDTPAPKILPGKDK